MEGYFKVFISHLYVHSSVYKLVVCFIHLLAHNWMDILCEYLSIVTL